MCWRAASSVRLARNQPINCILTHPWVVQREYATLGFDCCWLSLLRSAAPPPPSARLVRCQLVGSWLAPEVPSGVAPHSGLTVGSLSCALRSLPVCAWHATSQWAPGTHLGSPAEGLPPHSDLTIARRHPPLARCFPTNERATGTLPVWPPGTHLIDGKGTEE